MKKLLPLLSHGLVASRVPVAVLLVLLPLWLGGLRLPIHLRRTLLLRPPLGRQGLILLLLLLSAAGTLLLVPPLGLAAGAGAPLETPGLETDTTCKYNTLLTSERPVRPFPT